MCQPPLSFIANAHNELYVFYMAKEDLLQSNSEAKGTKAYNTCIAPQVTYRDCRGAGTTQAWADVEPE